MEYAYGYVRVSGRGQIKGDGFRRQEKAIQDIAEKNDIKIVRVYKETGVSGTIQNRPALAEMLVDIDENAKGVKTVIVEKLDRVARDLMIQESIIKDFNDKNVILISALEGPDLLKADPTRKLVRQVLGAISEYEKSMLVQKLRVARQRKKAKFGKCEGRRSYAEAAPETVFLIKKLRRKPKGGRRKTLNEIAGILNFKRLPTLNGQPWTLQTVKNAMKRTGRCF